VIAQADGVDYARQTQPFEDRRMLWLDRAVTRTLNGLRAWHHALRVRHTELREIGAELRSTQLEIDRLTLTRAELWRIQSLRSRNFRGELDAIKIRLEHAYAHLNAAAELAREAGATSGQAVQAVQSWHRRNEFWNDGKTPQSSWIWPDAQDLERARRCATRSRPARAATSRAG
jgi:hypothetical protein